MAGVEKVRFLKRDNLLSEQRIQSEYYRDLIKMYGVDVVYFRKDNSFYDVPSGYCNYTYGEDTTATYYLSAPMVVYMEMMGDSFLLDKFGIQTDGDATITIHIDDFYEQFRDQIGTIVNQVLSADLNAVVENFSGILSGNIILQSTSGNYNDVLSAYTEAYVEFNTSGYVSGIYNESAEVPYRPVNPDIAWPNYYDEYGLRYLAGIFNGPYEGIIDASGNGNLSGYISGDAYFLSSPAQPAAPHWAVDPQAGDFFRIDFDAESGNYEEYVISRVVDRDLQTDGVNPLLAKYIWKCDVTRRDPSYEDVGEVPEHPEGPQEEKYTESKVKENKWHESTSNEIFDYAVQDVDDVDGRRADNVYGDYGM